MGLVSCPSLHVPFSLATLTFPVDVDAIHDTYSKKYSGVPHSEVDVAEGIRRAFRQRSAISDQSAVLWQQQRLK